jgi:predicted restriction endonuclease
VTGIAVPEVLRASHAKPWAECVSDAERLDVFNGFLLSANLDVLFDRFLISFDDEGVLLTSESIPESERSALGLTLPARLRWVNDQHLPYLRYHRNQFANPNQSIGT